MSITAITITVHILIQDTKELMSSALSLGLKLFLLYSVENLVLEGCNLFENSTRPDFRLIILIRPDANPTFSNPTRPKPDT